MPKAAPKPPARPRQQRAKQTVERILQAAAAMLCEQGMDGFNTNAVAQRADINVSTLYQYFSNKLDILSALLERFDTQLLALVTQELDRNPDKHQRMANILDLELKLLADSPWAIVIHDAAKANPALETVAGQSQQRIADFVIKSLPRGPGGLNFGHSDPAIVVKLLTETIANGLRLVSRQPKHKQKPFLNELQAMINAYLDRFR